MSPDTVPPPTAQPSFTCPACRRTSYHPKDIKYGYCGACHAYTGDAERVPLPEPAGHELLAEAVRHAGSGARDGRPVEWIAQWRRTVRWLAERLGPVAEGVAECAACQGTGWKFSDEHDPHDPHGPIELCDCPMGGVNREHLTGGLVEGVHLGLPGRQHTLVSEVDLVSVLAAEARVRSGAASQDDAPHAEVEHWRRVRRWLLDKLPAADLVRAAQRRDAVAEVAALLGGDDERLARVLAAAVVYRADQLGALAGLSERTEHGVHPWMDAVEAAVSDRLNDLGRAVGLAPIRWDVCLPHNPAHVSVLAYVSENVHGGPEAYALERAWAGLLGLDEVPPDKPGRSSSFRGVVDDYLAITLWRVGGPEPFADEEPAYTPPQD